MTTFKISGLSFVFYNHNVLRFAAPHIKRNKMYKGLYILTILIIPFYVTSLKHLTHDSITFYISLIKPYHLTFFAFIFVRIYSPIDPDGLQEFITLPPFSSHESRYPLRTTSICAVCNNYCFEGQGALFDRPICITNAVTHNGCKNTSGEVRRVSRSVHNRRAVPSSV